MGPRIQSVRCGLPFAPKGVNHATFILCRNLRPLVRWQSSLSGSVAAPLTPKVMKTGNKELPPLSAMPISILMRTLMVTTFLSFPRVVGMCLPLMAKLSTTQMWLLSPDKNPVMRTVVKYGFYNNFAAGETETEVRQTVAGLKRMGCHGVILGYAREIMAGHTDSVTEDVDVLESKQIEEWKNGNLRTVEMCSETDFVAIKYTGAGQAVTRALMTQQPPPLQFRQAMEEIIGATIAKGARVVIDAEQWVYQDTIDAWTLDLERRYNIDANMRELGPPVYNTMQAYLKSTPERLGKHLRLAQEHNFTLAFKLVRGAYITSETRSLIHDTKEHTDQAYDCIVKNLIQSQYPGIIGLFPSLRFVVAGHNETSVQKALALQNEVISAGQAKRALEFGQIQGMADEITCQIAQMKNDAADDGGSNDFAPRVYKASCWGTVQECMGNLTRRAIENRAATERTKEWRHGLWKEVGRRSRMALSFR